MDSLVIAGGEMSVNDSILGTLTTSGAGAIEVIANDASMSLANVSVTGGVTIVNSYVGNVSIIGSNQADVVETNITNLGSSDVINGSGGTDTLAFTDSGTIAYTQFNGVSSVENLQLYSGDDTITFGTKANFDTWATKFSSVNAGNGTDTVSFSSAVTQDLDFSKLNSVETLSFSGLNDTVTFGNDEFSAGIRTLNLGNGTNIANLNANTTANVDINGGSNSDEFVLDFSRINEDDYSLNGALGSDTVKVTGNYTLSSDMNFANNSSFDNIERIDFSSMVLSGDDSNELRITGDLVNSWNNDGTDGGTIALKLTADQLQNIGYTDDVGTYHDFVAAGSSYTLQNGATLTIESIA